LSATQDESNRYANAEAIDRIGLVSRAKPHGSEKLAGNGRSFHQAHRRERGAATGDYQPSTPGN
jgi:hypothetical protein